MNLTLALPQKEGKKQSTLDRWLFQPKVLSRVRFQERVLLKEITPDSESWTTVPPWWALFPKTPRNETANETQTSLAKTKIRSHKCAENQPHTREAAARKPLTFLISFLKDLPTIQGGVMTAIGLDNYKKKVRRSEPRGGSKGRI